MGKIYVDKPEMEKLVHFTGQCTLIYSSKKLHPNAKIENVGK